jgi:hypothetical protein
MSLRTVAIVREMSSKVSVELVPVTRLIHVFWSACMTALSETVGCVLT